MSASPADTQSTASTTASQQASMQTATAAVCAHFTTLQKNAAKRLNQIEYNDKFVTAGTRPPNLQHVLKSYNFPFSMDKAMAVASNTEEQRLFTTCLNDILKLRQSTLTRDHEDLKAKLLQFSDDEQIRALLAEKTDLFNTRPFQLSQAILEIKQHKDKGTAIRETALHSHRNKRQRSSSDDETAADTPTPTTNATPRQRRSQSPARPKRQPTLDNFYEELQNAIKSMNDLKVKFSSSQAAGLRTNTPPRKPPAGKAVQGQRPVSPHRPKPTVPPPPPRPFYQQHSHGNHQYGDQNLLAQQQQFLHSQQNHYNHYHHHQQQQQQQQQQQYFQQQQQQYQQQQQQQQHHQHHQQQYYPYFQYAQENPDTGNLSPPNNLGTSTPRVRFNEKTHVRKERK